MVLLVLASARPVIKQFDDMMNIIILADRSDSITDELKMREEGFIQELIEKKQPEMTGSDQFCRRSLF